MLERIQSAANYISTKIAVSPKIGIILGSGLGVLAEQAEDAAAIAYQDIPEFADSTVEGHKGRLVAGRLNGTAVMLMQGRFHYYEGYSMQDVVLPVWVMKQLGIETLIVTNAAGGVNTAFAPGDLMLISDHIKFFTDSPLRGRNIEEFGPRFNDMSVAYTPALMSLAKRIARNNNIKVQEGVYAHMPGPSFETPAEIRMLRILGADAVGMSTVPEVIAAAHASIKVLGISAISNMAAGILDQPLNHEEVMETGRQIQKLFSLFITEIVNAL
jgi:purine-nucleoside phosphorylase